MFTGNLVSPAVVNTLFQKKNRPKVLITLVFLRQKSFSWLWSRSKAKATDIINTLQLADLSYSTLGMQIEITSQQTNTSSKHNRATAAVRLKAAISFMPRLFQSSLFTSLSKEVEVVGVNHGSQTQIAPRARWRLITRGPHYDADATLAVSEPY